MKTFSLSMYVSTEDLYKAKAEYYQKMFETLVDQCYIHCSWEEKQKIDETSYKESIVNYIDNIVSA